MQIKSVERFEDIWQRGDLTGKLTNSQHEIFTKKIINQNFMIFQYTKIVSLNQKLFHYVQTCLFPSSFRPKNADLQLKWSTKDESADFCPVPRGGGINKKKQIQWKNFNKLQFRNMFFYTFNGLCITNFNIYYTFFKRKLINSQIEIIFHFSIIHRS